jgi:hypothetical protein
VLWVSESASDALDLLGQPVVALGAGIGDAGRMNVLISGHQVSMVGGEGEQPVCDLDAKRSFHIATDRWTPR